MSHFGISIAAATTTAAAAETHFRAPNKSFWRNSKTNFQNEIKKILWIFRVHVVASNRYTASFISSIYTINGLHHGRDHDKIEISSYTNYH